MLFCCILWIKKEKIQTDLFLLYFFKGRNRYVLYMSTFCNFSVLQINLEFNILTILFMGENIVYYIPDWFMQVLSVKIP